MKIPSSYLEYAGQPVEELPPEVIEFLQAHPDMLAEFEQQAEMAGLMRLKNYEVPEEAMFGRVHHRVQVRLVNQPSARVPDLLFGLPSWARMVAVVIFMLGLSVITHREMLRQPAAEVPAFTSSEFQSSPQPQPLRFENPGSFTTYVLSPPLESPTEFRGALTDQVEADFEALGLTETNRFESTSLLPVRLPAGR